MPVLTEQHSYIVVFSWKQTANVTDGTGYRGKGDERETKQIPGKGRQKATKQETKTEKGQSTNGT